MSINLHGATNIGNGYNGNASRYERLNALNFPSNGIDTRPGCQLYPEFDQDASSSENSYEPQNFSVPEDTYVSQDDLGFVPYSRKSWNQNKTWPNAEAQPAVKPAPAARPNAPTKIGGRAHAGARVRPLRQSNGVSCGQTSVAMSINYLTGKKLTDMDINAKFGLGLLSALKEESRGSGYDWFDNGNFSKNSWPAMERRLNQEKTPIVIGLNGPHFSPSGKGHIVTLISINGDKVTYADPADGTIKTTTKRAIENAPAHPDGKFMYVASKV